MKTLALTCFALLCLASPAAAFLNVCNKTNSTVYVALGYDDSGTWMAEGWWTVNPGGCENIISGDLSARYYYLRGEGENGAIWAGDFNFCTSAKKFTLADSKGCESGSISRKGYFEVDVGDAVDWTTNLTPE